MIKEKKINLKKSRKKKFKLTQLIHYLKYEIRTTQKKKRQNKSISSRPNNLMLNEEIFFKINIYKRILKKIELIFETSDSGNETVINS
jgi:hypothetical protein